MENNALIKNTHTTKIRWIVVSSFCNMYAMSTYDGGHSNKENKTFVITMLYILKIRQCFIISSNHLKNFRVEIRHLLINTRVDLENGVAYIKKTCSEVFANHHTSSLKILIQIRFLVK